jgi:hypothetical protein
MNEVTLHLTEGDIDVLLDSLETRKKEWHYTAECLAGGHVEDMAQRTIDIPSEAEAVADYYQKRIAEVERQLKEQ